ncbi:MAG: transcriptional regulator, LysR family [Rhodospirillales bacterium]|nr:transcriptional regulator, LysR family [Rhodospirillales bacterium]
MRDRGTPSLDQLQVFLVVVETRSFAAAARRLGRATSAVSYTIANLETQLGIALFDRERTRKPVLTEAGAAVLSKVRAVTGGIDDLRASVKGLLSGLEPKVTLAVDVMLPTARLVDAVQAFETKFPTVTLHLHVEALSAVAQLIQAGVADIGIGGTQHTTIPGIERFQAGDVELIPVAAPEHPLARNPPKLTGQARQYRQLVLTVRSSFSEGQDVGVFGAETWRLADLGAKHALLLAGSGWGFMPEPVVREDLASARLVRLVLPELHGGFYPLQAIYRRQSPPGPASAWMMERFITQAR